MGTDTIMGSGDIGEIIGVGSESTQPQIFLVGKKKNKPAHIWNQDGQDTLCRMWSTGGMTKKGNFKLHVGVRPRSVCKMCIARS